MKVHISMRGEKGVAGSVYSAPDMAAAEQSEPSDEELAERDKEEAARQEQQLAKDRKEAAKKAAEKAKKPQQTPAEKGESEKPDDSEDDSEDEEDDDSGDGSEDDSEDEESDDSEDEESDDSEDDEESDDEESDDSEDDEEATAASVFLSNEFRNEPALAPKGVPPVEPAEVEKKALQEAALNAKQDDPNAKMEKPKSDTVKDVATAASDDFEATAAAYYEALPYPDVLPKNAPLLMEKY